MDNLQKQLQKIEAKIDELKKAIAQKESKEESEDWKPKMDEVYFFIDTWRHIVRAELEYDECDRFNLEKRNYYKTKNEAQFALDMYKFCEERSFTPNWGDGNQKKCFLYINYREKEVKDDCAYRHEKFAPFYYPSEEVVKEIINRYSFDELVKYYGRV